MVKLCLYYMSVNINFSSLINNIFIPNCLFSWQLVLLGDHGECAGSCVATVSSFLMGHLCLVFVSVVDIYNLY